MIHEQIDEDNKKRYFDKLGAKSDLLYVAIGQLEKKIEDLEIYNEELEAKIAEYQPRVDEFLEMLSDAGGKIYACKLAMDMFKLTKDDLIDQVEDVLTVGQFYEKSAGASIIFT